MILAPAADPESFFQFPFKENFLALGTLLPQSVWDGLLFQRLKLCFLSFKPDHKLPVKI